MKDAYWFKHDSNARNDEKIIDLRSDLGYEGYGIYWALVEFLRDTENYEAEYKPKRLALALQADEGLIMQIIEGYNLFRKDNNGKFYSESLKVRMKEMDRKREQQRQKALKRWNQQSDFETESHGNAMALPDHSHKSKEKERKEKNNRKENKTADERVKGEKDNATFFSECLSVRNVNPIILFFEYLYFASTHKTSSVMETRLGFLNYWKSSTSLKNGSDINKRIITMAKLGFGLQPDIIRSQLEIFYKNLSKDKTELEYYMDFLNQLKKEKIKPSPQLQAIALDFLEL